MKHTINIRINLSLLLRIGFAFFALVIITVIVCIYYLCEPNEDVLEEFDWRVHYVTPDGMMELLVDTHDELYKGMGLAHTQYFMVPSYPEEIGVITTYLNRYVVIGLVDFTQGNIKKYKGYVSHPELLRFIKSEYSLNDLIGVYSNILSKINTFDKKYGIKLSVSRILDIDNKVAVYLEEGSPSNAEDFLYSLYGDRIDVKRN